MVTASLKTLLIHEYATGGGLGRETAHGSWLAEGDAMRGALAREFSAVEGIQVTITNDSRLPAPQGPWQVLNVARGREEATVRRALRKADFALFVAPETDGLLLERVCWIAQSGTTSLGCSEGAVVLATDKWKTYKFLKTHTSIPQPRTWLVSDSQRLPETCEPPLVLKPLDGAGCFDTLLIDDCRAVPKEYRWPAVLQEYVPGRSMSCSYLIDALGRIIPVGVAHQEICLEENRFHYRGGTVPAVPAEPLWQMLAALEPIKGLRGWVGVDFIEVRPGEAILMELNPRVTTSFAGFQKLLPEGTLGRLWLGEEGESNMGPKSFAERVASLPPLSFTY
jgi:predicted ATP-grasp superfamily ATP-dependent carboligase